MFLARLQLLFVLVKVVILHQFGWQLPLRQMLFIIRLAHSHLVAFAEPLHVRLRFKRQKLLPFFHEVFHLLLDLPTDRVSSQRLTEEHLSFLITHGFKVDSEDKFNDP